MWSPKMIKPNVDYVLYIQVHFLMTQLIIYTHFDISNAIGGLLQEVNVQWSLLARWRGGENGPTCDLVCSPPRLCS